MPLETELLTLGAAVVAAAYDVTLFLDDSGVVRWCSGGVEELVGHTSEELIGRSAFDLIHESSHERAILALARVHESVNMTRVQVDLVHRNGSSIAVEVTGEYRRDVRRISGTVCHLRRVMGEIDGHVAPSTEHLFLSVLQCAVEGVVCCDADGVFTFVNQAMANLLRWPMSSGSPSSWPQTVGLLQLDESPIAECQLPHRKILDGGLVDADYLLVQPDGERRIVHVSGRRLGDPAAAPTGAVVLFLDITEQRLAAEVLLHRATHDSLTGLINRSALLDVIDVGCANATPGRLPIVLFIDVDHLKVVNDSLGHAAGDQALIAVANRLAERCRPADVAARFAGDEFVVFGHVSSDIEAGKLADDVVAGLRSPIDVEGRAIYLTISVGVAIGTHGCDATSLIRSADAATYAAKQHGRNRWEFAHGDRLAASRSRLDGFDWLRRALDDERVETVIQPIVDPNGKVFAGEVLARGRDADGRLIYPADFIGLAEEAGLIGQIDSITLAHSVETLAKLDNLIKIGCNVSPQQLGRVTFGDEVLALLHRHAVRADRLVLELTERSFIDLTPEVEYNLERLIGAGVVVGLDDFGTKFATMDILRKYRFSYIKIDRSFVEWVPFSQRDTTIVRCIVDLAKALGLAVIAEGIERVDQRDMLVSLGVRRLQGNLLSPPVSSEAFIEMARSGRLVEVDR